MTTLALLALGTLAVIIIATPVALAAIAAGRRLPTRRLHLATVVALAAVYADWTPLLTLAAAAAAVALVHVLVDRADLAELLARHRGRMILDLACPCPDETHDDPACPYHRGDPAC
jgi:hypothetical protein